MHVAVAAAEEFSGGIVGLQLDLHAVRILIYRLGDVRQRRLESRARVLRHFERRLHANGQPGRKRLRHLHVDANAMQVRHLEQRLAGAARVDQHAELDVAGGHDAVERRGQRLERLHGLELPDVGFVGVDDGLLRLFVGGGLVRKLLGHDLLLQQYVVPVGGERGNLMIGPHARERRFGLTELLIEIGSVDGGQHLPGLHRRPDVVVPALHISVHSRENRRPAKGLDIARQR